ncbi:hypothetical protein yrohd0001_13160 [Yersinia rohdei ATCC 43380]|nr:hypothetical protein yrohd0001_13160 [Yersinia rohdei ATCC 43380]
MKGIDLMDIDTINLKGWFYSSFRAARQQIPFFLFLSALLAAGKMVCQ